MSINCEGGRGDNRILEHNVFSKTSPTCHYCFGNINDRENRTGVDILSQCEFREEGVDERAGQNAMFSVFVSLSPFVFDTQSGRSLAHLKTHLERVTSKYFPSAAESNSRKINLWQAGCCVAYW